MTGGLVTASLADDGILAGLLFGLSFKRRSGSVEPGQPGTDADALEDPDVVDFESNRMTAVIHLSQFHVGDVSNSLSVALVELFDGRCIWAGSANDSKRPARRASEADKHRPLCPATGPYRRRRRWSPIRKCRRGL